MADTTIKQLTTVIPKGVGLIPLSQDNVTVNTLASSITASAMPSSVRYSVEYLVVGGGGGGGQDYAGGGGAGGYVEGNMFLNVGERYQVIVGLGGRKDLQHYYNEDGTDSVFGPVVAFGGGAGMSYQNRRQANNGGSGGGCGYQYAYIGRGFPGQGNNGIIGGNIGSTAGGGGGGAGGVPLTITPYIGGVGKSSSITGTSTLYASGGSHIGDLGTVKASDPTPNTGHGGNSAYGSWTGDGTAANGATGIVVIAYAGAQRGTAYNYNNVIIPADTSSRAGYTVHKFTQGGYYIA